MLEKGLWVHSIFKKHAKPYQKLGRGDFYVAMEFEGVDKWMSAPPPLPSQNEMVISFSSEAGRHLNWFENDILVTFLKINVFKVKFLECTM